MFLGSDTARWFVSTGITTKTEGKCVICMCRYMVTLKVPRYLCINHGDQRVFQFQNHHKCLFPLHMNTCVIGLRCGEPLYMPESDIHRRQILTYKDGSRSRHIIQLTKCRFLVKYINPLCAAKFQ